MNERYRVFIFTVAREVAEREFVSQDEIKATGRWRPEESKYVVICQDEQWAREQAVQKLSFGARHVAVVQVEVISIDLFGIMLNIDGHGHWRS